MANYGIVFCKKVLSSLQKTEDDLMAKTGLGFYMNSQEWRTTLEYRALLQRFQKEKDSGLSPSYRPSVHGSLHD